MDKVLKNHHLPLQVCKLMQPQATINKLHTIFHIIIILSLFYYRASQLFYHQNFNSTTHFLSWLLIFGSEILLSFLWFLGQAYRWGPVTRTAYPERLPADAELPPIDIFIPTADPVKEPTVEVMNTVISAMSLDYPPEKLSVYLSDDAGSQITLFAIKEAFIFGKSWVPFCHKYGLETRCPEAYLSSSVNDDVHRRDAEFVENKETIKSKYEIFKNRVEKVVQNGDASIPFRKDHSPWIEVINEAFMDDESEKSHFIMPLVVYVAREKRPSSPHHFKAGALNVLLRVSGIMSNAPYILVLDCDMYCNDPSSARQAMCFHLDSELSNSIAFVQFPQEFHNITENDIYNGSLRSVFRTLWYGLDGIKGPILSGTGFYIKREALYSTDKKQDIDLHQLKQQFGNSNKFIESVHQNSSKLNANGDSSSKLLMGIQTSSSNQFIEARVLASCAYEEKTTWGEQRGFRYHSVVEDYFTGFNLHCQGWMSVYYSPTNPPFLGSVTTNLNDSLVQGTRWNSGLLQVGFSRFCPLTYGLSRMSLLHCMAYANLALQPLYSLPFLCLATIPQICLFHGLPLYPKVSDSWFYVFLIGYLSNVCQTISEVLFSKGSMKMWWYEYRMSKIRAVTAFLVACLDMIMKFLGFKEIEFLPTNKVVDVEQVERYKMDTFDFQTSNTFLFPLTSLALLNMGSFIVGLGRMFCDGSFNELFVQMVLSFLVLLISFPVIEGMFMRKDKGKIPTTATLISFSFFLILLSIKNVFM